MKLQLFPHHENFFDLFGRQGAVVREGCEQLEEMVTKFDNLEDRAKKLKEVEHRGDLVTHEIFERLNRTFITPLEREDIHALASGLDDVLDSVEAIGHRFVIFKVKQTTNDAVQLAKIISKCSVQIESAVNNLKDFKNLMGFTIETIVIRNS